MRRAPLGQPFGHRLELELLEDRTLLSWATLASMPTPRMGLAATTGLDGKVYALGGQDVNEHIVATAEVYNPATNTWSSIPDMPTARTFLAAATGMDGRIYAIGGVLANPDTMELGFPTDVVEVYNPGNNQWTTAAPMPTARAHLAVVTAPDGRLFAIGGVERRGGDEGPSVTTNVLEVYNPNNNQWTTSQNLPFEGEVTAAMGADGRMYAMADRMMAAYNLGTMSWTIVAGPPFGESVPQAAPGQNGMLYAIGGQLDSSVESYNPQANKWTIESSLNAMPTDRENFAVAPGSDGRIFAVGGETQAGAVGVLQAFTPDTSGALSQRYVSQVYRDFLQREADPNGLAFWASMLDGGRISRVGVVLGVEASQEYRELVVSNLYLQILSRPVDPDGLQFWTNMLAHGASAEDVEAGLLGSGEDALRFPGNENYVVSLYNRILNRSPGLGEILLWQNGLNNGLTRTQVAADILHSAESDQDEVTLLYQTILRRDPDPAGLAGFTQLLQNGLSDEAVAAALASSDEYVARL